MTVTVQSKAVLFREPGAIEIASLPLAEPGPGDVVVAVAWSGISTGTERLLWSGRMPPFPGLRYPLVPGYEAVGRVVAAGPSSGRRVGETVFVPGARCFGDVASLFGGSASRLVSAGDRVVPVGVSLGAPAILLALAATAHHAVAGAPPDLVVGHGILGRLAVRVAVALGAPAPVVWERDPDRRDGADPDVTVVDAADDTRRDYGRILDASGDASVIDALVARLARGGEIVLGGFYEDRVSFAFPPVFAREARFRCAAEWRPADLDAVASLVASGRLSLDGLVSHTERPDRAEAAYRTAFEDPRCRKMVLDWREAA